MATSGNWRDNPALVRAYELGTYRPFGESGGGGGSTSAAAPAPPTFSAPSAPTVNTAQNDPHLDDLWKKYQDRFSDDNTKRAIDRSNTGIADSAALLGKDARASLADRGALGTGVGAAFINKNITAPAQRQAAGAAADISMDAEKRKDALVLGGVGLAGAQSDLAVRQQANANQQYATSAQIQMQQQEAQQRALQQQQAQWMALMNSI